MSGGITMSFLEMVTPATVAYLKPMSLSTSSRPATAVAPKYSTRSLTKVDISRLVKTRFWNS